MINTQDLARSTKAVTGSHLSDSNSCTESRSVRFQTLLAMSATDSLEDLKASLKNLISVQVNLVTTVQESITAVAKVLEALDNESLSRETAVQAATDTANKAAHQISQATVATTSASGNLTSALSQGDLGSSAVVPAPQIVYASFSYQGEQSSDLSFAAGDKITVVKEDPSGWWLGQCNGQTGLFPMNFVCAEPMNQSSGRQHESVLEAAPAPAPAPVAAALTPGGKQYLSLIHI
eukprot:TRINITY_DN10096_c0_g1_i1.p1 TRINITY_DN10096_c0_g1~~TRINITY_DN10096_c0_g1_i1.p1  ORF type:complete len:235 (+),score=60.75 TRINITY_DN10096_c0_g1_i1:215-919(+)